MHPEHFRKRDGGGVDMTDSVRQELAGRFAVSRAHTPATAANLEVMDDVFRRYMFAVRDLRDVTVSIYYHLHRYPKSSFIDTGAPRLPWQPLSSDVLSLPKERCVDAIIDQLLPPLVTFVRCWLDVADSRSNCLLLRYEDITRETEKEVRRVLRFFEIEVSDRRIQSVISRYHRSRLDVGRWKFRKGGIGDWETELTSAQQQRIEQLCGDLLAHTRMAA